jgi:hypothetical protein
MFHTKQEFIAISISEFKFQLVLIKQISMQNIRIIISSKCYQKFAPVLNNVDVMLYKKVKIKVLNEIQNTEIKTVIIDNIEYAKY